MRLFTSLSILEFDETNFKLRACAKITYHFGEALSRTQQMPLF